MKRTAFLAFVLVTTLYIFLGSLVFYYIEGANEKEEQKTFQIDHQKFLDTHTCLSREALHEYVTQVIKASSQGVHVMAVFNKGNNSSTTTTANTNDTANNSSTADGGDGEEEEEHQDSSWDLASTVLFSLTVVSTVGYGNLAPKTMGGQAFCIVFALLGIPLFATSLVGVGERLQIPLKHIKKCRPWYKADPKTDEKFKTAVFLTSGMCLLIFIPSYVLSRTEDWTYIESLYFCIISLTTIGFGDYIPGRSHNLLSFYLHRIALCLWILLGLSWVALILSELASIFKEQIVEAARKTTNKIGNFEDLVKKKAKDARERIAHKASIGWRRFSQQKAGEVYRLRKDLNPNLSGVVEEVDVTLEDDVYVIKREPGVPTKHRRDEDSGTPGVFRSLSPDASPNSIPDKDDVVGNHIDVLPKDARRDSYDEEEGNNSLSRVDVR